MGVLTTPIFCTIVYHNFRRWKYLRKPEHLAKYIEAELGKQAS